MLYIFPENIANVKHRWKKLRRAHIIFPRTIKTIAQLKNVTGCTIFVRYFL